jgi:hypothetical protein
MQKHAFVLNLFIMIIITKLCVLFALYISIFYEYLYISRYMHISCFLDLFLYISFCISFIHSY